MVKTGIIFPVGQALVRIRLTRMRNERQAYMFKRKERKMFTPSHEEITQVVYNTLTQLSRDMAVSAAKKDVDTLTTTQDVAAWLSHYKRLGYKTFVPALYARFNLTTATRVTAPPASVTAPPAIGGAEFFDGIVAAMARQGLVSPVAAPAKRSSRK